MAAVPETPTILSMPSCSPAQTCSQLASLQAQQAYSATNGYPLTPPPQAASHMAPPQPSQLLQGSSDSFAPTMTLPPQSTTSAFSGAYTWQQQQPPSSLAFAPPIHGLQLQGSVGPPHHQPQPQRWAASYTGPSRSQEQVVYVPQRPASYAGPTAQQLQGSYLQQHGSCAPASSSQFQGIYSQQCSYADKRSAASGSSGSSGAALLPEGASQAVYMQESLQVPCSSAASYTAFGAPDPCSRQLVYQQKTVLDGAQDARGAAAPKVQEMDSGSGGEEHAGAGACAFCAVCGAAGAACCCMDLCCSLLFP